MTSLAAAVPIPVPAPPSAVHPFRLEGESASARFASRLAMRTGNDEK